MLNKLVLTFILLISTAVSANQLKDFGLGLDHDELIAKGYKSTKKTDGPEIYYKSSPNDYSKIVSKTNEYVSTIYRYNGETYLRHTELDESGSVKGIVECKRAKGNPTAACDVQTAEICHQLIAKMDSGGFGFDSKKIQECAEISSKISYDRSSVETFFTDNHVQLRLKAIDGGAAVTAQAPAVSLQTLLKDYAACKKVESHLVPAKTATAVKNSTADKKGNH